MIDAQLRAVRRQAAERALVDGVPVPVGPEALSPLSLSPSRAFEAVVAAEAASAAIQSNRVDVAARSRVSDAFAKGAARMADVLPSSHSPGPRQASACTTMSR